VKSEDRRLGRNTGEDVRAIRIEIGNGDWVKEIDLQYRDFDFTRRF